ncbi:MAG: hypothetical protein FD143_281 [Ignavibacteria bacterium]|nr:MAG: hypothetical protein FD143_281 [Ignavibacteria bacterium]KAF0160901.1 MAG: hypothetical protein FD188_1307 [Ignavibacteria bacterium]
MKYFKTKVFRGALVFNYVTQKMKSETNLVDPLAYILILARQIEHLADHAANIAEHALFLMEAKAALPRQVATVKLNSTQSN